MGIFSIFNIGAQSLNAYSAAMNVVSNNISNANNENYTRQRVSFESQSPQSLGGSEIGRGIFLSGVSQVVDTFIENRLLDSQQAVGESEARSDYLKSIEGVFNELDGNGLNDAMSEFFDSWTALSAEPADLSVRNNVLNSAQVVIDKFSQYANSLTELQNVVDQEIRATTPIVNDILTEIRDLNTKIDESATDDLVFRDERRGLLKQLGEYIDVNVIEDSSSGVVQVYTKGGIPLVSGNTVASLSTAPDATNNNFLGISVTVGSTTSDITGLIQEGRLKGLIDIRDTDLDSYIDDLDNMAFSLVNEVNTLHSAGFDLAGVTGVDFFTDLGVAPGGVAGAAGNLSIGAGVLGNPAAIAASDVLGEIPGNNTQALAIAALGTSTSIDFDHGAGTDNNSYVGFFGEFLTDLGSDSLLAQNNESFQKGLQSQIELERASKSGVNIDEEEINMIKFQAAIQASSRLVSIAGEVLDQIINIL